MKRLLPLFPFLLAACGGSEIPDLSGRWIDAGQLSAPFEQGFELNADGTAVSIGLHTVNYCSWQQEGDLLVLMAERMGNEEGPKFADTLHIVRLENDTMTVQRGSLQSTYVRQNESRPVPVPRPSRESAEGFEWQELEGAGLKLPVQRNEHIRLLADPSLPGVVMVRDGDARPHPLIRVFSLEKGDINEVLPQLAALEGWDASQTCRFRKVTSRRRGVSRYVLEPDGDYARRMKETFQREPVPYTCSGWGIGNSGYRYFEVPDAWPNKAIFVEVGQDAPLFDEQNIDVSEAVPDSLSTDVLLTLSGTVRLGHEVRSFRPAGSNQEFWLVDKTGTLAEGYDRAVGGRKDWQPAPATLRVEYAGKWTDGFAADYDGVYLVREVVKIGKR